MGIKDLKIASKLVIGFSTIVVLTVIIGITSIISISKINQNLKLNNVAAEILYSAEEAQSSNLRLVFYRDLKYHDQANKNLNSILTILKKASDELNFSAEIEESAEKTLNCTGDLLEEGKDYVQVMELKTSILKSVDSYNDNLNSVIQKLSDYSTEDIKMDLINLLYYYQKYSSSVSQSDKNKYAEKWSTYISEASVTLENFSNIISSPELAESCRKLAAIYKSDYLSELSQLSKLDNDELSLLVAMKNNITSITDNSNKVQDTAIYETAVTTKKAVITITSFLIIIIIFSFMIGLIITRSIAPPIRRLENFLTAKLSEGDLTSDIDRNDLKSKDEIGDAARSCENLVIKLREVIATVYEATRKVAAGSEQIAESANQLSTGASEQASSMEEVSSSMEELASNVEQNTENAVSADTISEKLANDAAKGEEAVKNTVAAMKSIAEKIIIIDDLARNTNMLALNAAIEAARAGEAGKGFAVVASEVRKLAENSQKAAGDISEIARTSVETAEYAGNIISNLIPDIKRNAELMQEISNASREQSNGAQQINTALMQLDTVTQGNASASEEMAGMSAELSLQADTMEKVMAFFSIDKKDTVRKSIENTEKTTKPQKKFEPENNTMEAGNQTDDGFMEF